ncbi:phage tail protein [Halorientalis pallida]|uniref:Phage tail protein n=1 Tax=Halorientalis pallida TaxID=2479928 RepID=A0A498KX08_9EURY|nr:tail fiber protein [Halorientalis pallida]RXK50161.1 phage tail protein [Halorientalis pallida]
MSEKGSQLPRSGFVEYVGETFTVHRGTDADTALRLREVVESGDGPEEWAQFTLRFEAADRTHVDQGSYRVTHPELGSFRLALVPVTTADPDPDAVAYEAVFTRHEPTAGGDGVSSQSSSRRGVLASILGVAAGGSLLGQLFGGAGGRASGTSSVAQASGEPLVGEIRGFGFDFAPQGWAQCNGQILPVSQNQALFSLLGTRYGGDGRSTFGLPDLQGRVPVHQGRGPEGRTYRMGQTGGNATVSLSTGELPSHSHENELDLPVSTAKGTATSPDENVLAAQPDARGTVPIYGDGDGDGAMDVAGAVGATGDGRAHENRPPYQTVNYCIALTGVYPSRD